MAKRGKPVGKAGRRFIAKNEDVRKNSQTIRRLLHEVVCREFDRDYDKCFEQLTKAVEDAKNKRGYSKDLTPSGLKSVLIDRTFIGYSHLDAVAKYYKIPISLLLAYTRIRDECEDIGNRHEAAAYKVLTGLQKSLDHLKDIFLENRSSTQDVETFLGFESFKVLVSIYQGAHNETAIEHQPSLPI